KARSSSAEPSDKTSSFHDVSSSPCLRKFEHNTLPSRPTRPGLRSRCGRLSLHGLLGACAKIAFQHPLVTDDIVGPPFRDDGATFQESRPIGDRADPGHVLLRYKDRHAVVVDRPDDLTKFLDNSRSQTDRGLVQKKHERLTEQNLGKGKH